MDSLARDLASAAEAERAEAAAAAREAAQRDTAAAVAAAQAAAEKRGREEGRQLGFDDGRKQGREEGRKEAAEDARKEGVEAGRRLGLEEGRKLGVDEGRKLGVEDGRKLGLEEGRKTGLEEGRKLGLEEGRKQGFEAGRREGYAAGLAEGRDQGLQEGRTATRTDSEAAVQAADSGASERLADALRAIDRGRSLSEILDTLASCAGRETARVAVMLVRGTQLRGWRFFGFGPSFDQAQGFEAPLADAGIIAEAVQKSATTSGDSGPGGRGPSFAPLPPGRTLLAVPLLLNGEVVAVLYGDTGADGKTGEVRTGWPAALEVLSRHAARSLEAITAFRAAQMLTAGSGQSNAPTHPLSNSPGSDGEQTARRYARLLVSEIKLYHEPEVMAGRRERDLAIRLGGEIARARVLYEQRVPRQMRVGADFFHDELVQTLADGDASLLKQPQ